MIRFIWKQIWNQRSQNGWIFIELVIVSFFLWSVIDPVYVKLSNMAIESGYDEENTYKLSLGYYPETHRHFRLGCNTDSAMQEDFLRIQRQIKALPEIESYVTVRFSSFPNSFSYNGGQLQRDTLLLHFQHYGCIVTEGSDMLRTFHMRDAYANKVLSLKPISADERAIYLTKDLADRFFPEGNPVGKELMNYDSTYLKVAGVIQNFKDRVDAQPQSLVIFLSNKMDFSNGPWSYNICFRVKPGINLNAFEDKFRKEIGPKLQSGNYYFMKLNRLSDIRRNYETASGTTNTIRLQFSLAGFALLCVFLGMVGTFWIRCNARRQEIGLMRAMGCSVQRIRNQFLCEGWLLLTVAFILAMIAQIHRVH